MSTVRDGVKILRMISSLVRYERPVLYHGLLGTLLFLIALVLSVPLFTEYARTGLVPRFPTAILASSLVIVGVLSWVVGLVLDAVTKARREAARLNYLRFNAVGAGAD